MIEHETQADKSNTYKNVREMEKMTRIKLKITNSVQN